MANKVTYGLEQVHIAFIDTTSETQPTWKTPVAIPGAVRFTPTPLGEEATFYADNGPYFSATSNNGYTAELELALVPDAILAEMLGWEMDQNGMLVEIAGGIQKKFALLGQVEGDEKNRRFVYYNCKASRPAREDKSTGETVQPTTEVLNLTILPMEYNGKQMVKGTMELNETNAAAYNNFFTAVTLPGTGGGGQ